MHFIILARSPTQEKPGVIHPCPTHMQALSYPVQGDAVFAATLLSL